MSLGRTGGPPSAQTPSTDPRLPALGAVAEPAAVIATDPHFPPAPGVLALRQLLAHLGEAETAPNQGPVVEWACRRWAGKEWWDQHYPRGEVPWCAGAVSSAFSDAGIRFPGSLSCDGLLWRLQQAGWLVWDPAREDRPILPGDIAFWGPPRNLQHVGLVEDCHLAEDCHPDRLFCVEGNHLNQVARRSYDLPAPRLAWIARHP